MVMADEDDACIEPTSEATLRICGDADRERRCSAARIGGWVLVKVMVHSNVSPAKNDGCLGVIETTTADA